MGIISDKNTLPSLDAMEKMPWHELYALRLTNRGNQQAQQVIAPFEHMAYAREQVRENPLTAPVWGLMPAGYQAYKALGGGAQDDMTTPASLDQATAGMKGVWQGLSDALLK